MAAICRDLKAEQDELIALVTDLGEEEWNTPTPAEGWTVRDQIGHLAYFDEKAVMAHRRPEAFAAEVAKLLEDGDLGALEREHLVRGRSMTGPELLAWWEAERSAFDAIYRILEPNDRVLWYGPSMAARSKVTARIMETWAHGQDVRDALGVTDIPTGRLRHVCHIGVRARRYAFTANGLDVPDVDVNVLLEAPDGTTWEWGPPTAKDVVDGSAVDFALLVTQRRHRDDLALTARGDVADQWLDIAQAFAGPPGPGRRRGQFSN